VWLVVACIAASIIAAASLRWINPPVTAFMAETQVSAWLSRE